MSDKKTNGTTQTEIDNDKISDLDSQTKESVELKTENQASEDSEANNPTVQNTQSGEPQKRRPGRPPKNQNIDNLSKPQTTFKQLKKPLIIDEELKEQIEKSKEKIKKESLNLKLSPKSLNDIKDCVDTINTSAGISINNNDFIRYALEIAEENLHLIIRKYLDEITKE